MCTYSCRRTCEVSLSVMRLPSCRRTCEVSLSVMRLSPDRHGTLGRPTGEGTRDHVPTPGAITQASFGRSVISSLSVGWYHVLALSSKGVVFSWGLGRDGQLGVPLSGGGEHRSTPAAIPQLLFEDWPVVQVSAGGFHSLVRTASGVVWAFGANSKGQVCQPTPLHVQGLDSCSVRPPFFKSGRAFA